MKLVIDIPNNIYDAIKKTETYISGQRTGKTLLQILMSSVDDGTPLEEVLGEIKGEILKMSHCELDDGQVLVTVDDMIELIDSHISGKE